MSFGIRTSALLTGLLVLVGISCRPAPDSPASPGSGSGTGPVAATNAPPDGRKTFDVKGVVRELVLERKKARIAHEEIPGYMAAMTMLLDVRDVRELNGLEPGDNITFRMVVTDDDGWIENIKKLDLPKAPLPPEAPLRRVREVDPLMVGDTIPDYSFTNMLGGLTRLSELRGRAVAFTFIFTRCPFPTYCPRLNTAFQQVHDKLKAISGGPTNWTLLSMTMDPAYDTPARLKEYAQRYQPDTGHWLFVTGDLIDITAIGEQFGLQFWRPKPAEPISHNMRTVVLDGAGRVVWISNESEFKVDDFVSQMLKAAALR